MKIYLGLVFLLLLGCSSSDDDELTRYMKDVEGRKPRPIQSIPPYTPVPQFLYPENDTRRSPFQKKENVKTGDLSAPDTHRTKQPLEFFPLDALKFVGILKQGNFLVGLVREPDGFINRVKVGNYMGQNFGKIVSIDGDAIKIEETVKVADKWQKKMTDMKIEAGVNTNAIHFGK